MKVWPNEKNIGLVVGNASLAAGASPGGRLFGHIQWNPPCFEEGKNGMVSGGGSEFYFEIDGVRKADSELKWIVMENTYPVYRARALVREGLSVEVCAFAPLSPDDMEPMFLPVICTSLRFTAEKGTHDLLAGFFWQAEREMLGDSYDAAPHLLQKEGWCMVQRGDAFVAFDGCEQGKAPENLDFGQMELQAARRLSASESWELKSWFGYFPAAQRWRRNLGSAESLCEQVRQAFPRLWKKTQEWIEDIPHVGDDTIWNYTRWYSQAAVLLTKADCTGKVITMGYRELNQRDSFWTSYVHLYFWPELERVMIRESCQWQREDGKVPTTILPVYERQVDVDINEYFCLRIARYYRRYRDLEFLGEYWENFKRSVDYLLSRDLDSDGLPEQAPPEDPMCFWADWKDVRGITGRKLAPHFVLLWLAVLQEGIYLAHEAGDAKKEQEYQERFQDARAKTDLAPEQGGLWESDCYREVWYDGNVPDCVLIDQTVGMAFDVVDFSRAERIYQELGKGENKAGIPETYPFRENMEYPPGVYHNGGIWPYLVFCDCMGRYRYGRWQEAESFIRRIGYYDLEAPGDWAPNEYLNALTLENCGAEIQGWSSALFGTLTHGAFSLSRQNNDEAELTVNFPQRDFSTFLLLPEPYGKVRIGRKEGKLFCDTFWKGGARLTLKERERKTEETT